MPTHNIEARVRVIIIDKLGITNEDLKGDPKLTDIGADSLDMVEVILEIEEEFHIRIPDNQAFELSRISEIVTYLQTNT